jgi:hypothetical protein
MNIFMLSWDPAECARFHCDKHVVKMIIESAQLLYSAHWLTDPSYLPPNAYKLAHKNHPCSKWVRESIENYIWLCRLGWFLCKEYTHRYGKVHKTEEHIVWLMNHSPEIPYIEMTKPALAMPDEYKQENVIQSYHTFYIESKFKQRQIVKYTKREWPSFINGHL